VGLQDRDGSGAITGEGGLRNFEAKPPIVRDWALLAILGAGLLFRVILAANVTVLHADEVWQYIEPAYGLVTGHWVHAWEFHAGLRGWLVPLVLTIPIGLGHLLAPDTQLHLHLLREILGLLSMAVVWAWYRLAEPFGRRHALVAAWVAAIWCEVVYFGVRPSAEGLGISLLFPAMALAQMLRRAEAPKPRMAAILGLLLALGFIVRFHYLPAIGLIGLWSLGDANGHRVWGHWRQVLPGLATGFAAGIALGALGDVLTGHAPLLWIWHSIAFNVVQGGSDSFGTQPPWWFVVYQGETWSWAGLALAPLILIGAWRQPMLLAIAIAIYLPHSAIAHKEYRFVILGTTTLVLLAAIGSVDLLRMVRQDHDAYPVLVIGWFCAALGVAMSPIFINYWGQGDKFFSNQARAGEVPGICGLAVYKQLAHPALTLSFFNRDVPALLLDGPEAPAQALAMQSRFNVAIASAVDGLGLPHAYHRSSCWHQEWKTFEDKEFCVFVRPGPCSGTIGDFAYQPGIERRGK
jgi:hypothetical protein